MVLLIIALVFVKTYLVVSRTEHTRYLTLSLPELVMETCSVVLTFDSVDKILWCEYSNETCSVVLLHGTIWFSLFYKMKFKIFLAK